MRSRRKGLFPLFSTPGKMYLEYDKFWKRIIEANFLYKGYTAFTSMSNSAIKVDHSTEVFKTDFQ